MPSLSGDDVMTGTSGDETINSGAGDDTLDGGAGSDILKAGSGDDVLIYQVLQNIGAVDIYNGGSGSDTIQIWTTGLSIEQLQIVESQYLAYLAFLDSNINLKTGEMSNSNSFTFDFTAITGSTLTVSMIEKVELRTAIIPDTTAPTLTITNDQADNVLSIGETATFTLTFSEAVTGFDVSDLTLDFLPGTLGPLTGSGANYSITYTPILGLQAGPGILSVNDGSYADLAGNVGSGASSSIAIIDTNAPSVSISSDDHALNIGDSANLTLITGDPGFEFSDMIAVGGTLSDFQTVDGIIYKVLFTPTPGFEGEGGVSIAAGSFVDGAGNPNTSSSITLAIDTLAPVVESVSIFSVTPLPLKQVRVDILVDFSEAIANLEASDFRLVDSSLNGTVIVEQADIVNIMGDKVTVIFTAPANQQALFVELAGDYTDLAGNTGMGYPPSPDL